ncbi:hypothetical protein GCM10010166_12940 [Couchioplanes caeruleus subsp. azureus]|nr:hypothetical protein GCM10010166_12940 [Couchioplanes caeruleus subsp. azureus]
MASGGSSSSRPGVSRETCSPAEGPPVCCSVATSAAAPTPGAEPEVGGAPPAAGPEAGGAPDPGVEFEGEEPSKPGAVGEAPPKSDAELTGTPVTEDVDPRAPETAEAA